MPTTLDHLEGVLGVETPKATGDKPPTTLAPTNHGADYDSKLRRLGARWKHVLATPGPHEWTSASECDMAVVAALVKRNFTDGEIVATLESSARYADRVERKGETHARKLFEAEIAKARGFVDPFPEEERRNGHARAGSDVPSANGAIDDGETPAGDQEPNASPDVSAIPEHLTDLGNAEYLIARYGGDIRFAPGQGFVIWSGKRWKRDIECVRVERLAQRSIRALYQAAYDEPDGDRRARIAKHAAASESASRLLAMVRLARSQPNVVVDGDAFDRDRFLLNVANGTLDLRTGELRPHRRSDLITKISPADYDPDAQCPVFFEFLDRIFDGNQSLIDFIRRAMGYALTGDVSERVIFFFWGRGRNGKSTLIGIIMYILGDYASQAAPGVLMAKKFDAHPAEIADLAGARFVAAIESEEGRWLAEANVKHMTGNDRMKGRFMRENWFDFEPTHKVFLATNHKPIIRGTDPAIWDRIRLIPFNVRIPEEEEDRQLKDKLRAEAPGILAWAVRGAQEWFRDGLGTPGEVRRATAEYREEMDVLGAFIGECCVISPGASVAIGSLYAAYVAWCAASGERALPKRGFGERLDERGYASARGGKGVRHRHGIALADSSSSERGDG